MRTNFALAFMASLSFVAALPVAAPIGLVAREEKRDTDIYTYYTIPTTDKEKRDTGIYTYYASPVGDGAEKRDAEEKRDVGVAPSGYYEIPKEKRDVGIYTYYEIAKEKRDGLAAREEKRDVGIYTYYEIPKEKRQDFAEDEVMKV